MSKRQAGVIGDICVVLCVMCYVLCVIVVEDSVDGTGWLVDGERRVKGEM